MQKFNSTFNFHVCIIYCIHLCLVLSQVQVFYEPIVSMLPTVILHANIVAISNNSNGLTLNSTVDSIGKIQSNLLRILVICRSATTNCSKLFLNYSRAQKKPKCVCEREQNRYMYGYMNRMGMRTRMETGTERARERERIQKGHENANGMCTEWIQRTDTER